MRALLMAGLLAASESLSANSFDFAGISRATTVQDIKKRYPNSELGGDGYVRVSPKDSHYHIFGIQLATQRFGHMFGIRFGSPSTITRPAKLSKV